MNISKTGKSLLILLNNADEVIVKSNDRAKARDIMKALTLYANSNNYAIPEDRITYFNYVLLDSRPNTLSSILREIGEEIVKGEIR